MTVSFPEFVRQVYSVADDSRDQAHWFRDSLDWLVSSKGEVTVDRILRFENLQEDFSHLALELGLVGELYDVEARRIIGERFRPTLETFGYRF
jgi:hypothetical protein